jgi:hypothetical protein
MRGRDRTAVAEEESACPSSWTRLWTGRLLVVVLVGGCGSARSQWSHPSNCHSLCLLGGPPSQQCPPLVVVASRTASLVDKSDEIGIGIGVGAGPVVAAFPP